MDGVRIHCLRKNQSSYYFRTIPLKDCPTSESDRQWLFSILLKVSLSLQTEIKIETKLKLKLKFPKALLEQFVTVS
jgi:hypothetical protein